MHIYFVLCLTPLRGNFPAFSHVCYVCIVTLTWCFLYYIMFHDHIHINLVLVTTLLHVANILFSVPISDWW